MTIEALIAVVAPPKKPVETPTAHEIKAAQAQLGLTLPSDYLQLQNVYGVGSFFDFLLPLNIATDNPHVSLLSHGLLIAKVLTESRRPIPMPIFPTAGGLLPWAVTDNGDMICWLTRREWPTVVLESRGPRFSTHRCSTTEFLTRLATGKLRSRVLPKELHENRYFTPSQ